MEIVFRNKRMERLCTEPSLTERTYGSKMAEKIHQRIDEIRASESIEMMIAFHIGRCHPLKSNRKGQYAMDLIHPYRLVFAKGEKEKRTAMVIEIVDYHG